MFAGISIALSGMEAASDALQTISSNVANLNTLGFKQSTVEFGALFNQGDPGSENLAENGNDRVGDGVQLLPMQTDFTQGTLEQTSQPLDLSIQGGGFYALLGGVNPVYVRTASFGMSSSGQIIDQANNLPLAILNGKGGITTVSVAGKKTSAPKATTSIQFTGNLSSSATTDTVSSISVYDALGNEHTWSVAFAANASLPGTWNVTVTDETGATIGTGTINFLGSVPDPGQDQVTISTTYGKAPPLAVTLDFSNNVTSFSGGTSSTLATSTVDGYGLGSLSAVAVESDGTLQATYSNGQTANLGTVAIAQFSDPQSLQQQSGSGGVFQYAGNIGPSYVKSGADGVGTIVSGELEESNVDLSSEFGELIVVQRGFQASSEVISTANDMIQQLFGIRGQP